MNTAEVPINQENNHPVISSLAPYYLGRSIDAQGFVAREVPLEKITERYCIGFVLIPYQSDADFKRFHLSKLLSLIGRGDDRKWDVEEYALTEEKVGKDVYFNLWISKYPKPVKDNRV